MEGSILIDNLLTNQTEALFLTYDPSIDYETSKLSGATSQKSFNLGFLDYLFFTFVLILVSLLFFYNKNSNANAGNNRFGGGPLRPPMPDFKPFEPVKRVDDSFSRKYNPYNEQFVTPSSGILRTPLEKRKNLGYKLLF